MIKDTTKSPKGAMDNNGDDPDPDLDLNASNHLLDTTTWKIQEFRNKRKLNDEFLRSLMSAILQVPDDEWDKLKRETKTFINRISPKKTRVKTSDESSSSLNANCNEFDNLFSISFPDQMADNTNKDGGSSSSSLSGSGGASHGPPTSFGDIVDPRDSALARSLAQRSASSSDMEDEESGETAFKDELVKQVKYILQ